MQKWHARNIKWRLQQKKTKQSNCFEYDLEMQNAMECDNWFYINPLSWLVFDSNKLCQKNNAIYEM